MTGGTDTVEAYAAAAHTVETYTRSLDGPYDQDAAGAFHLAATEDTALLLAAAVDAVVDALRGRHDWPGAALAHGARLTLRFQHAPGQHLTRRAKIAWGACAEAASGRQQWRNWVTEVARLPVSERMDAAEALAQCLNDTRAGRVQISATDVDGRPL